MTNADFARHIAIGQQRLNSTDYDAKIAPIAADLRYLNEARLDIIAGLVTALRLTSYGLDSATTNFVESVSFETLIAMANTMKVPHDEESWLDDEYPGKEDALRVAVAEALHGPPVDKGPEPEQLGPCTSWGPETNPMPLGSAFPENQHSTYAEDEPVKDTTATNWVDGLTFRQLCSAADRYGVPHNEDRWLEDDIPDKTDELRVAVAEAMGKVGK